MVGSPTDVQSMREAHLSGHRVTSASVMVALLPVLGSTGVLPARIPGSPVMARPIVRLGDRSVVRCSIAQLQAEPKFDREEQPSHASGGTLPPSSTRSARNRLPFTLPTSHKKSHHPTFNGLGLDGLVPNHLASDRLRSSSLAFNLTESSSLESSSPVSDRFENTDADEPDSYLTLLETYGTLEQGDRIAYQDGSLYDEYAIDGSQGQQVHIHLESPEFDPYLVVIGPSGNIVAQNDDVSPDNYNAFLDLVLPSDGIYRVVANGFDRHSRGGYRLMVRTPLHDSESTEDAPDTPNESPN